MCTYVRMYVNWRVRGGRKGRREGEGVRVREGVCVCVFAVMHGCAIETLQLGILTFFNCTKMQ